MKDNNEEFIFKHFWINIFEVVTKPFSLKKLTKIEKAEGRKCDYLFILDNISVFR